MFIVVSVCGAMLLIIIAYNTLALFTKTREKNTLMLLFLYVNCIVTTKQVLQTYIKMYIQ